VLAKLDNNELKLKLKPVSEMKKTTKKSAATSNPATTATPVIKSAPGKSAAPVAVATKPVAPAAAAAKAAPLAKVSKPVATVPAVSKPASPKPVSNATIEAKIDVGFGNRIYLRGQGSGLSWERGVPLECVDSQTWRLTVPAQDKLLFKLLLNDSIWAKGEDVVVTPGQRVEITPAF